MIVWKHGGKRKEYQRDSHVAATREREREMDEIFILPVI
jgi:hypothetical protein